MRWRVGVPLAPRTLVAVNTGWPQPGEVELVARRERAAVVAVVARETRDLALAEDAVQDALLAALEAWPRRGVPARPGAWLTVVARRAAWAALRGRELLLDGDDLDGIEGELAHAVQADRLADPQLELLFACCHPVLALETQVALTLRTVAGLTTPEIARALLVSESALAQRLARAQRKIRDSGVPFAVPAPELLAERLAGVLGVVYLIFTEGHAATSGAQRVRVDLCEEAVLLGRLVATLLPDEPEALGLAALVLAHDARRAARVDPSGLTVPLDEQDRSRYDTARLAEASGLLERALGFDRPGPYQVQAAIACLHTGAPSAAETDWAQITALYDTLLRMAPTPMVALNRAAAIGMSHGPQVGLATVAALELRPELDGHHLLHTTRAELLRRLGRDGEAGAAYRRALELLPAEGSATADLRRRLASL
jgi:RNA polymerase sigma-70 factor (ECF subfamily)